MTDKLLPCPFCGGEAELDQFTRTRWSVDCGVCEATMISCANRQDAIDNWNLRAAPRRPEVGGLSTEQILDVFERNGFRIETGASFSARGQIAQLLNAVGEICRLSDAQRAIAELREECKIQRNSLAGARNQLRANRLETERLAVDWQEAVAERDTLRQQLAERDAELAMLRDNNRKEAIGVNHLLSQRDKLAGLLRDERTYGAMPMSCQIGMVEVCHCSRCRFERVDAALAEVK